MVLMVLNDDVDDIVADYDVYMGVSCGTWFGWVYVCKQWLDVSNFSEWWRQMYITVEKSALT